MTDAGQEAHGRSGAEERCQRRGQFTGVLLRTECQGLGYSGPHVLCTAVPAGDSGLKGNCITRAEAVHPFTNLHSSHRR